MQARLQTTQDDGNQSRYVPGIRDKKKKRKLTNSRKQNPL